MSNVRAFVPSRLTDADGLGGWLLVGLTVAYLVGVTWWRVVPIGPGVGFLPAWIALVALCGTAAVWLRSGAGRRVRPLEAAALVAVPGMLLTDLSMTYQPLRDLGIYLKAGAHFLAATPVYLQAPIDVRPADLSNYPFLYPPLTLPFFAALSALPQMLAQAAWVGGSLALGLAALRSMGLRWRWVFLAILWPPLFQGLWVGNVAVPALALFALAPRYGGGLVVGGVFKSYTGIAALWLVRERRWLELLGGVAIVVVLGLATLPLTGPQPWLDWLDGLGFYQASQANLPILYGFGLTEYVPAWLFLALGAAAVLAAIAVRGRAGLARLGTATIVASPSLWGHGMLMAVPSLLYLRPAWLWLALAVTAAPDGIQWWWLVAVVAASWAVPAMRRDAEPRSETASPDVATASRDVAASPDWLDPLAPGATGPWPDLEREAAERSARTRLARRFGLASE